MKLLKTSFLIIIVLCNYINSNTINVPEDYTSIQLAINAASDGDTILVASGIYSENLVLNKNILLSSVSKQPDVTLLGDNTNRNIYIDSLSQSKICGFIITQGKGVYVRNSNVTISNCIFEYCSGLTHEGLIDIGSGSWDTPVNKLRVSNSIFRNNIAGVGIIYVDQGMQANILGNLFFNNEVTSSAVLGMIHFSGPMSANIINNTIANNIGSGIHSNGALGNSHTSIINNIIVNNSYNGLGTMKYNENYNTYIAYNNVWNNVNGDYSYTIDHNLDISVEPLFIGNDDYRLQETSLCIDSGHPFILDDFDGTRSDIGAYGGTKEINDVSPPSVFDFLPENEQISVKPIPQISFKIRDNESGVDLDSMVMTVEGNIVQALVTQNSDYYLISYTPTVAFDFGQIVDVTINAKDISIPPNIMQEYFYSFTIDTYTNRPPYYPDNPKPPNNTKSHYRKTYLYWGDGLISPADPDSIDTVTYSVYLEKENPDPQYIYGSSLGYRQEIYIEYLEDNTDYYWKVVAKDQDGAESVGPVWKFRTESRDIVEGTPFTQISKIKTPSSSPSGLANDGQYLWSCDDNSNKIYKHKLNSNLSLLEEYENPQPTQPYFMQTTDLSWGGNYLYLSASTSIITFDSSMNVVDNPERNNISIDGIAWVKDHLIFNNSNGTIFKDIVKDRTEIYLLDKYIKGMDWDGTNLWIATNHKLYRFTYDDYSQPNYIDLTPIEIYSFYQFDIGDIVWNNDTLYVAAESEGYIYSYINSTVNVKNKQNSIPQEFALYQNYPNPYNPSTVIEFAIPTNGNVNLRVFNNIGEEVAELVNGEMTAGYHSVHFNATNLSSGVYFYRISFGNFAQTNKMIFIK